ncbi:amidohydrolase family protein [Paenarthrobacter aromaticivorans]|uniref:Amidohydrolase n=1 Tax=Paenarthrobacter aromaticivorans TaxID=2849150 RepID=A0ABS6I1H5_9MICC|nr:amidohydrolase family protein [Paenarthrobacter sp. MMS21-TAE1-1]MBU8865601.1 amidohydrolase [Paenarthrobacter sp. MMS21-TAE1-1]
MYSKDGEDYFVVDSHVHMWDGSDENQRNIHGAEFIECFYAYHRNLSPEEYVWDFRKYQKYTEQNFMTDIFENGYVDHAIFNPAALPAFYKNGFSRDLAQDMARRSPERLTYNHNFDPRFGEAGLRRLEDAAHEFGLKGVKIYTAEWHGESRGFKMSDRETYRYLEKCQELGIKNIHVHKGPTIKPLDRDSFDVADIDYCATDFPDLNFIVEHVGLPRLEDFCWIATQETNVYGGLAVAMPFIHTRPRYWAQIIGELLYWIGEDKILFGSDYALWQPKWLVEKFVDFQIPEDMQGEYGEITVAQKKKILGLNAAALYPHIEVPEHLRLNPAATEAEPVGALEK